MHAFWSRQLTYMEVLGCGSVRVRVFLQGLGIASSLNTSLIVAYICVMEVGDLHEAEIEVLHTPRTTPTHQNKPGLTAGEPSHLHQST